MSNDKDTRYFLDVDLVTRKILEWNFGPKDELAVEVVESSVHRIFLTKGQYHKFIDKIR